MQKLLLDEENMCTMKHCFWWDMILPLSHLNKTQTYCVFPWKIPLLQLLPSFNPLSHPTLLSVCHVYSIIWCLLTVCSPFQIRVHLALSHSCKMRTLKCLYFSNLHCHISQLVSTHDCSAKVFLWKTVWPCDDGVILLSPTRWQSNLILVQIMI